jgi:hypothetical protein
MLKLRKQAAKRDVPGFRLPMLTHEEPMLDITDITVVTRIIPAIWGCVPVSGPCLSGNLRITVEKAIS